jgi:hypothetical protein
MKTNYIKQIGRVLPLLAALTIGTIALGAESKKDESMCVKQKDGTYLCKASSQKMDKPCLQHARQLAQGNAETETELSPAR